MLLNKYISYRESLSLGDTDELIITFGKPYHPASKDTIARWIKDLMRISGVDTDIFKPHSCRSASTSKEHITGVSIDNILKCGQWSSDSTFYKFYCRNIDCQITQEVLNFLLAFCLKLIVHNTFGSLHSKLA